MLHLVKYYKHNELFQFLFLLNNVIHHFKMQNYVLLHLNILIQMVNFLFHKHFKKHVDFLYNFLYIFKIKLMKPKNKNI